jgi:hypothetical protein
LGGRFINGSGAWRGENEVVCGFFVIASAAKQSMLSLLRPWIASLRSQ